MLASCKALFKLMFRLYVVKHWSLKFGFMQHERDAVFVKTTATCKKGDGNDVVCVHHCD